MLRFRAGVRTVELGLLAVRVGLGLLFLTAGLAKLTAPGRFQALVYGAGLTGPWADLYAAAGPGWEVAIGVACLLGWATRAAGAAAALVLAGYAAYFWLANGGAGRPPWGAQGGPPS